MLIRGDLLSGCLLAMLVTPAVADDPVDFARDVEPLLASRCFPCHAAEESKGGLKLVTRESLLEGGDGGPAIEVGDGAESLLIERVSGADPSPMPPKGKGQPLRAEEVRRLRAWIDEGAKWDGPALTTERAAHIVGSQHWAFRAPVRPELPSVGESGWVRNAIDVFLLARIEAEGLRHAPDADRPTLIRRLGLDLTGLPPSPEEVEAFARDCRPDAYERLVDRLLASPAYGERWGRRWLDLARYADTNGYEKDRERSIWPYRDWVIRAINADMPFDRFTVEQVAGDLLPGATLDQKVATGFHRNTMINEEGGIDVEEFRFAALVDRIATTGTVWLGLTLNCAQCHTHKYDPIPQRDYYRLMALMDNADEPELEVTDADIERRRAEVLEQIARLEAALPERFPANAAGNLAERQAEWERSVPTADWVVVAPARVVSRKSATMEVLEDASVLVSGDKPNNDVYDLELPIPAGEAPITGLRIEALPHPSHPDGGPGRAPLFSVGDFILTEVEARTSPEGPPLKFAEATHDHAEANKPGSLAIDGQADTGWSIKGGVGKPHHLVLELAEPLDRGEPRSLHLALHQFGIHQMTLGRFRVSFTSSAAPVRSSGVPAEVEAALRIEPGSRDESQRRQIREQFLTVCPELAEPRAEIETLRASLPRQPTTMVMEERRPEHRRVTRIRRRGEFIQAGDAVEPGVPAALHPLPSETVPDRLALSRWLVVEENPLVARVVVNRDWHAFFGRGLVTTLEDFGARGERPTHPELLDWLAREFVEGGWSRKGLHRLIVTSAAYRQDSRIGPEGEASDPSNAHNARGPRYRVEAEVVRDLALAASGLLVQRIGGRSVYPPQPEGVTSLAYGGPAWPTSEGNDRYRRGLYTFTKRTAPYATFTMLDMPTSETTCPRRERSNTPLQSLTLLNDPAFMEAARALAARVLREAPEDFDARMDRATMLVLGRHAAEVAGLTESVRAFHSRTKARIAAGEIDTRALVGDVSTEVERAEHAAWTAIARVLLNLDQAITRE